ncbi:hypothetical protein DFP72DRAFT_900750 [Ephemerocybe angulata]|uniref:Uncharacterized protein n=1 Tax=Ephemerocybe angulata TaxID=980116 RepID=A0A8H6HW04_9AGAR|nr:hypothetical protein DFP72DRAFT_900750 [Tulosesus angulatus]
MRAAYSSAFLFYVMHAVSGMVLMSNSNPASLSRRGECDSFCNKATATFTACESAANPDQCACTLANYNLLHDCFTCTITEAQGNEAAVGAVGGTASGGAYELAQQADAEEKQFFANCAATGYTLTGSTASGGTTAGGVGGGTTSGVAPGGSATTTGSVVAGGGPLTTTSTTTSAATGILSTSRAATTTGTSMSTSPAISGGGLQGSASRSASWSNFGVVTLAIVLSAILL